MKKIIRIERVVAEFIVWLGEDFPFAKMKVKVTQRLDAEFLAVPNLHVRDRSSGNPDYIAGLGATIDAAVSDLLHRFSELAELHAAGKPLTESDFEWSSPDDF